MLNYLGNNVVALHTRFNNSTQSILQLSKYKRALKSRLIRQLENRKNPYFAFQNSCNLVNWSNLSFLPMRKNNILASDLIEKVNYTCPQNQNSSRGETITCYYSDITPNELQINLIYYTKMWQFYYYTETVICGDNCTYNKMWSVSKIIKACDLVYSVRD